MLLPLTTFDVAGGLKIRVHVTRLGFQSSSDGSQLQWSQWQ